MYRYRDMCMCVSFSLLLSAVAVAVAGCGGGGRGGGDKPKQSPLIPSAVSLRIAETEQLYQAQRKFGGIGNLLLSTYSQTDNGEDPLVSLVNLWTRDNHTWWKFGETNWRWPHALPCVCTQRPPCEDSKRPCVYRHHAHLLKHMCAWCRHTRGCFECTHGGVFESTHGFFFTFFQRAATQRHTQQPTTTPHHNDTHHTTHNDTRRQRDRQRERDRERERQKEGQRKRDKTRQEKGRNEKMKEERREKTREDKREQKRRRFEERRSKTREETRWKEEGRWKRNWDKDERKFFLWKMFQNPQTRQMN